MLSKKERVDYEHEYLKTSTLQKDTQYNIKAYANLISETSKKDLSYLTRL